MRELDNNVTDTRTHRHSLVWLRMIILLSALVNRAVVCKLKSLIFFLFRFLQRSLPIWKGSDYDATRVEYVNWLIFWSIYAGFILTVPVFVACDLSSEQVFQLVLSFMNSWTETLKGWRSCLLELYRTLRLSIAKSWSLLILLRNMNFSKSSLNTSVSVYFR